jgi:hypothetical protein
MSFGLFFQKILTRKFLNGKHKSAENSNSKVLVFMDFATAHDSKKGTSPTARFHTSKT